MNDKITLSTFQIFQKFPDQESARMYLETDCGLMVLSVIFVVGRKT